MRKSFKRRAIDGARNLFLHGHIRHPSKRGPSIPEQLRPITEQIKAVRHADSEATHRLLDENEAAYVAAGHHKFLALNYYHAGNLTKAAHHARQLPEGELERDEQLAIENILFEQRALERMDARQSPIDIFAPTNGSVSTPASNPLTALYLASASRPYIISGYTSRGEAIVRSMREAGMNVSAITRPGFPADRRDAKHQIPDDDAMFEIFEGPDTFRGDLQRHIGSILPDLVELCQSRHIGIVHAVSNYRNGAIGYVLSRRLGVPFVYEIRGLWEETMATKRRGWRNTERFRMERSFEEFLYRAADGRLVITRQVRDELDGPAKSNSALLPNCVARRHILPTRFRLKNDDRLRIGYIGSIMEYEGLDTLIRAMASLSDSAPVIELEIAGKGEHRASLERLAAELELSDRVIFRGVVNPAAVADLYARLDLCVFPRKPYRVCELVSPLKPLEAMARDVNCILSDVPPLLDLAEDVTALTFLADDADALADTLRQFIAMSDEERRGYRQRARSKLLERYTWEAQIETIQKVYADARTSQLTTSGLAEGDSVA